VLEAAQGQKALEAPGQYQGGTLLLLAKVMMPGMSGWGRAKRLTPLGH
jgi:CheY-like chemotaxis protein